MITRFLTSFACLLLCLCLTAPAFAAGKREPATDSEVVGGKTAKQDEMCSGNVKTRIFHNKGCKFYDCKPCTAKFKNRKEAEKAGYKPCGKCGG